MFAIAQDVNQSPTRLG